MHVHSLMNIMRVGGVLWHQRVFGLVRRLEEFGRTILYVAPCQWITLFFTWNPAAISMLSNRFRFGPVDPK